MGKLANFVLGLFPSLMQEFVDAQVNKALIREYHDEILRLRSEVARLRQPAQSDLESPYPVQWPIPQLQTTQGLDNASTSDAWQDEPLRKSKRQQCVELEEMYRKQLISEEIADKDMDEFYG